MALFTYVNLAVPVGNFLTLEIAEHPCRNALLTIEDVPTCFVQLHPPNATGTPHRRHPPKMNTHSPTRRGPKVLAITAIMALLSLLGFAAPAQAATPITISNVTTNVDDGQIGDGETFTLSLDWAVDLQVAASNPVQFTIPLAPPLVGVPQSFPMTSDSGPAGTCVVTATQIECVLDETFVEENPLEIKGNLNFSVRGDNKTGENQTGTILEGTLNAVAVVVTPEVVCQTDCDFKGLNEMKWGSYTPAATASESDIINWWVQLPATPTGGIPGGLAAEIRDTFDPNKYELLGDPTLFWATNLYLNEKGAKAVAWDVSTPDELAFSHLPDPVTGLSVVNFTTLSHEILYQTPRNDLALSDGVYIINYTVKVLNPGDDAVHTNTVTYKLGDTTREIVGEPVERPAGGGTVVGTNEGRFSVKKTLSSDTPPDSLPQEYTFNVEALLPDNTVETEEIVVEANGNSKESNNYPRGTQIKITEASPGGPGNINWETSFAYGDQQISGNSVEFEISGGFLGRTTAITATNTATLHRGSIDIHKVLNAPAAALPALPKHFDVEYSWPADASKAIPAGSGTVSLNADGTVKTIDNVPVGAVVSFEETGLVDTTSYKWSTPSFSPETVTLTAKNQSIDVTLTNTATLKTGDFVISKSLDVTPEVAALIPDGYEFTVDYSWAANADLGIAEGEGTVAVPADGTEVTVEDLPVGAVVSFEEVDLPGIGNNTWTTPKFSPETVTIEEGSTPVSLNLTNKSSLNTGEIVINKVLEAPEYAFSALPTSFEVDYSWPANSDLGFPAGEGTVTLAANGESKTIADVPVGAVVTFTETTPSDTTSYAWNTPTFSPSASVTVEEAEQSVEVTLTNSVTPKLGSVDVFKELNAPAAATPLLPESYTVNYSWEEDAELGITGGEGSVTVIPGDEPTSINDLPVGAVITFEEVTPAAVPSHNWSDPVYSDESVTVGSGDAVSFTVTNSLKLDVGSLAVKKKVVAPAEAAGLLPATYPVTYSWDANPELGIEAFSATIDLPGDGTPVELNEVPVDAIVKFREGSVAAIGSYEWATPVFSAADVVLADTSEPIEIELTNVAMLQTRSISINKAVVAPEGVAALLPESYEVTYSWPANTELGFLAGEGTVTLPADGTLVEIADVPLGAVLTFVESALPGIGSNEWQTPVFSDNNIVVGAEGSATSVTVTNTAELLTGSISINKIVEAPEEASGLLPAEYPVTYTWEANNELGFLAGSGSVALPADGSPIVIEGVPVGAVVNFVEDALPTIGSNVWETPVFSTNNVTVTEAGQEVAVSLTNTAVLQTGSITIHKIVEAPKDATGLLPSEYPVFYTWAANADLGFAEGSGSLMLAADGTPQTVSAVPLGAVVTFEEGELPAIEGFEWSAPTFSENDVVVSEAGADVALSLTNTLAPEPEEGQLPDVEESTPPTQGGSELPKTGASGLVTGGAIAVFLGLLGLIGVRVASKRQH